MRTSMMVVTVLAGLAGASTASPEIRQRGVGFEISISAPELRSGASGAIALELRAADGRRVNGDYPIKIAVTPAVGIAAAKTALGSADALVRDERLAAFSIEVTGKAAGDRGVELDIRFAVCSASACELQHRAVAVPVHVR